MSRMIDIEQDRLLLLYDYDEALNRVVKTFPGRKFDWDSKLWWVPAEHARVVVRTLVPLHFKFSPRFRDFCDETYGGVETLEAGLERVPRVEVPEGTLTIGGLNARARGALQQAFPESVWIVGELQNWDKNPDGRHAFFELVERPGPALDPSARVRAVLFAGERAQMARLLEREAPDVSLRDGLMVRFRVDVELYAQSGSFQLIVREIDPAYTSGKLQQNRDRILRQLEAEAMIERNLGLVFCSLPLRVGLITSDGSDAYNDFVHELQRSGYPFAIDLVPASMQGANTERSVLRALRYFERCAADLDVVVIVRGGGSRSDLAYFDTIAIGRAVCCHPIKVIVGVGHHRDQCLLDFIAHAEKTPTAAAQCLVGQVEEARMRVESMALEAARLSRDTLDGARQRLERDALGVERTVQERVVAERRRLDQLANGLIRTTKERLTSQRRRVDRRRERIASAARAALRDADRDLDFAGRRLDVERIARVVGRKEDAVDRMTDRLARVTGRRIKAAHERLTRGQTTLRLVDPARVLERGFAIVRVDGAVARSVRALDPGARARVELADGAVDVRVDPDEDNERNERE